MKLAETIQFLFMNSRSRLFILLSIEVPYKFFVVISVTCLKFWRLKTHYDVNIQRAHISHKSHKVSFSVPVHFSTFHWVQLRCSLNIIWSFDKYLNEARIKQAAKLCTRDLIQFNMWKIRDKTEQRFVRRA